MRASTTHRDEAGRSMYYVRTAELMNIMLEDFHTQDDKDKEEILRKICLIVGYSRKDAVFTAKNVLCEENFERLNDLVATKGDYAWISDQIQDMHLKPLEHPAPRYREENR
ncbi:hypothetical protein PCASD_07752 [Puccinia coronata f. sp. avenae]|uniref:Uncharacterized protein n=1 Tax=Puccinia coronata f. sp. avenae TaxID=200324 RepID=A0A2N5UX23_9BASI|nr:hypothetical protein PCASD_07752 [Puccinia coronata f. sp. avenae]